MWGRFATRGAGTCGVRLHPVATTPASGLRCCSLGSGQARSGTRPAGRTGSRSEHGHGRADDSAAGAAGGEGAQAWRSGPGLHYRHRDRFGGSGVQHRCHAGVRGGGGRPAGAGGRGARVCPDAADLDRLQRAEQGRPRLRHHLHLGDAGVRSQVRVGGRLGDHRRRRAGHGQPRPGCRAVRVLLVQRRWHRRQPGQRLGAARRGGVDRGDDLRRLPGHRAVRQRPEGAAEHRARHAARALDGGAGQGRSGAPRVDHPELVLVQPVRRAGLQRICERHHNAVA